MKNLYNKKFKSIFAKQYTAFVYCISIDSFQLNNNIPSLPLYDAH